jgi:single-strand DNA-binding protein
MAKDLNQCSFIGRLGKDVEMRYMASGDACANFSIAVGEQWKDKQSGEKKEKTEWVNISCFGKLAEICGEYLKKGSKIYASGSMETRKYTGNDGVEKYATGIKLKDMQMLDSAPQNAQGGQTPQQQSNQRPQQQQAPAQQPAPQMAPPQQQQQAAPSYGTPPPNHQAPQQQQGSNQYNPNDPPF